jgi:hypothetical protein
MYAGGPAGSYRRVSGQIAEFLGSRLTPGEVKNRLTAAPQPAAQPAASAASVSIFGGPTPAEKDALTEAVRRRLAAMTAKS